MNQIIKRAALATVIALTTLIDIPFIPIDTVSDAQAIFGVRRRTAVIAYTAGEARAARASAYQHEAAAAPPPQNPAPQQPAASAPAPAPAPAPASQAASAVPVGTIVQSLPGKCVPVTVADVQYHDCEGSYYRTAFQGNNLVYVVVEKPL